MAARDYLSFRRRAERGGSTTIPSDHGSSTLRSLSCNACQKPILQKKKLHVEEQDGGPKLPRTDKGVSWRTRDFFGWTCCTTQLSPKESRACNTDTKR